MRATRGQARFRGKARLPRRSRRGPRYIEAPAYLEMVARVLRAAGRRVAQADVEDFRSLLRIRAELDAAILEAVRGLRAAGCTWQEIGVEAGTTRQAALMRWGRQLRHQDADAIAH